VASKRGGPTASAVQGLRTCPPPAPPLHGAILSRLNQGLGVVRAQSRFDGFPEPALVYFERRTAVGLALYDPWAIALNRGLFEAYPDENIHETVLHELAHLVVGYGRRERIIKGRITAHGEDWQRIMRQWFRVEPSRTHSQDTDHLDIRRQRRWSYRCGCRTWQITTVRHNRVQQQGLQYRCQRCRQPLTLAAVNRV
jgi:SprT protein